MRKFVLPLLLSALGIGFSHGQTSETSQPATTSPTQASHFAPGTKLRVELDKTIDAKKAKPGDPVLVKTLDEMKSGGEVVAPRGSKIIGHVVAASAHEKGSPSRLEIAFDKFDMEHGTEAPMKATVQALAKPAANPSMATGDANPAPSGGAPMGPSSTRGGMPQGGGGAGQPGVAPNAGTMGSPGGASDGVPPQSGRISLNAEGVEGMPELSLTPGPAQDSILTSEKHNVKLESGTQMILRIE
jgi:hypothetical protein